MLPPPEGVYKCTSVYKPIKSEVSCVVSVNTTVYVSVKEVFAAPLGNGVANRSPRSGEKKDTLIWFEMV